MAFQQQPITEEKALQRLAALCSRGEHSSGEMDKKMRQWRLTEQQRSRILAQLIDEKYVDDERFCHAFVQDKIDFNAWGRRKIEAALLQKGIGRDIYAPILDNVDKSIYVEKLSQLIAEKRRTMSFDDERETVMRLVRFALGRGFTYDVIKECLNQDIDEDSCDDYD